MNQEAIEYQRDLAKPVLVVGASGFVGSQITLALVAAGRNVRVMVRNTSNTEMIDDLSVERFYGDVNDIDSLKAAMHGCATVFYSVVDARAWLTDPAPLFRCNVDGLLNAMDAALVENIQRFVFTSSIATIGRKPQGMASERDEFDWWDTAPDYIRSRVQAENKLMQYCREKNFPGVALCVANTYGPGDVLPTPHGELLWHAAIGKLPIALDCSAPTVDIRDSAEAALLAERYGRIGERYIIANEYISQPQLYRMAASQLGKQGPRKLSIRMAYLLAGLNEVIAKLLRRKDIKLCRNSIFLSEVFGPLDNAKVRDELGWQPRPIETTIRDAIDWFCLRHPKPD